MATTAEPARTLAVGTEVDVFSRFRQEWVRGFEIAAVRAEQYAVRRRTDWAVLPGMFQTDDVRVSRGRNTYR